MDWRRTILRPSGKESGKAGLQLCGLQRAANPGQAPKGTMREPTHPGLGEGRCAQETNPTVP